MQYKPTAIRGGCRICGKGGGAAATASATGAKVFGGSRLKTLFGISKGGRAPPAAPPPPESASGYSAEIVILPPVEYHRLMLSEIRSKLALRRGRAYDQAAHVTNRTRRLQVVIIRGHAHLAMSGDT